jgi:hypothetical protein
MSKKKKKKKGKAAASKRTMKKAPKPARRAVATNRTAAATIFVYKTGAGTRVRTSPQLLVAGPGYVEWTVVNLMSDDPVDVEITFPGESPFGSKDPISVRGCERKLLTGTKSGRFKYKVTADGYTEDPEIEYPQN